MRRYLMAALAAVALALGLLAPQPAATAEPGALAGKSVCVDPGHGGSEPGAVNGSLLEKEINLDEALHLRELLEAAGATVYMTREADVTLSTRQRYEFCNSTGADILVSVHTNSVSDQTVDGTLAIYFHSDDEVLATALHNVMWERLKNVDWEFTDFGVRRDALGIVLKSDMPAAVAEPVFMSHPGEAEWLASAIANCSDPSLNQCRRAQIVQALFDAIVDYFEGAAISRRSRAAPVLRASLIIPDAAKAAAGTALAKKEALADAGATIVDSPADIGAVTEWVLRERG